MAILFRNVLNIKPQAVLLIAGLGLVIAYQLLNPNLYPDIQIQSYAFLALGFVFILVGASAIQRGKLPVMLTKVLDKLAGWLSVHPAQILYLFLGFVAVVIAVLAAGDMSHMRNLFLGVSGWVLGIVLVILGSWNKKEEYPSITKQTLILLAVFFAVGFLLRGFNISEIPKVLSGDEGSGGLSGLDFLEGRTNNIFLVGWFDFPSLYFYLQSVSISIFGPTIAALRIPSALIGALTVPAVYLLGRVFFNHRTGILAGIFMAGFHYHIHFSRLGLNNIWDGLWFVVVLGGLYYGWSRSKRSGFLIAGVGLGLSQYFYVSSRALFALIPIWLIISAILDFQRFKRNFVSIVLMSVITLVAFLPLANFFYFHPEKFLAPQGRVDILGDWITNEVQVTGLPSWQIILQQIGIGLLGFTSIPILMFYAPGVPLLRTLAAGVFLISLVLLLLKIRETRTLMIFGWLATFAVIAGLSLPVPAAQRYVAAAPAIALVAAFGLSEIAGLFTQIWEKRAQVLGTSILLKRSCV